MVNSIEKFSQLYELNWYIDSSRKMNRILIVLITLCCCSFAFAYTPLNYTNDLQLNDDYHLYWYYDDTKIYFECRVRAQGWVGLGISPNGGMEGGDIAINWLGNDGKFYTSDRFREGTGNGYPVEDDHQDAHPIGCFKNDTHMIVQFWRYHVTCDKDQDLPIKDDTSRLIFAYSDAVPYNSSSIQKHASDHCGTVSVDLLATQPQPDDYPKDTPPWDLTVDKVEIPSKWSSAYWCQMYKAQQDPLYLVGNDGILQAGNEAVLHHMLLYGCTSQTFPDAEKYVGVGGFCATSTGAGTNGSVLNQCQGTTIAAWAVGGQPYFFPSNIARPMFGSSPIQYFMLQVHYNNVNRLNYTDSSGIRLYLTKYARELQSSQIVFAAPVSPYDQFIPPHQEIFTTYVYCPSQVTKKLLPKDGITIFGGILHSHLTGRQIYLKQIKNGVEQPDIMSDDHYDFNYQNAKVLSAPVTIMPGDDIVLICAYNTTGRNKTTYGGLFTEQEMCFAFMDFYPFTDISPVNCGSGPATVGTIHSLGGKYNETSHMIDLPSGGSEIIYKFLDNVDWTNSSYALSLQNDVRNGFHIVYHTILNDTVLTGGLDGQYGYPKVTVPYVDNSTCYS